jgi:hypothetical protein
MTAKQFPGFSSYPTVVTQYTAADGLQYVVLPPVPPNPDGVTVLVNAGLLDITDTESRFNLNGPASTPTVDNSVKYILPGLPYDPTVTPPDRLLKANLSSGGSAVIGPPDFGALPAPVLADFRGIFLRSIGDFARIRWTGFLWSLVETGGPSVSVAGVEQNEL